MSDPFEVQRAIRNATERAGDYTHKHYQTDPSPNDGPYWHKRCMELEEELFKYRRESWRLRDELLDLKEAISKALERKQ